MFTPLNKHVLITPTKQAEKSASGLYLPTKNDTPRIPRGVVAAVAEDAEGLSVGDAVLYRRWSEVSIDEADYHLTEFGDVLGKM